MIGLLASLLTAQAFQFERVDLISEDPGTYLVFERFRPGLPPARLRWLALAQVKGVVGLDRAGHWQVGLSAMSQSLVYERELMRFGPVHWNAHMGVQTALLLPRGMLYGTSLQVGNLRVGAGASVLSGATWKHRRWTTWTVLPTVAVGIGRSH